MHNNCRLLPDHIVCKITQRNNIRRANTCDPGLKLLNERITSDIHKPKHYGASRFTMGSQAQHTLWKPIHGLYNRAPHHTVQTTQPTRCHSGLANTVQTVSILPPPPSSGGLITVFLCTLISSTSPALDKHLNHVYHPYTHSPQPHLPRPYTSIAVTLPP